MSLEIYIQNGLELLINPDSGEVLGSQSALVRMAESPKTSVRDFIKLQKFSFKKVEVPTDKGIRISKVFDIEVVLKVLLRFKPEKINEVLDFVEDKTGIRLKHPVVSNFPKKVIKRQKIGYLYLFTNSAILKLGFSINPKSRLKQLERWEGELKVICIIKGSEKKEKQIHSLLHQTGEYFGYEWYPAYRKHEILNLMGYTEQSAKYKELDISEVIAL